MIKFNIFDAKVRKDFTPCAQSNSLFFFLPFAIIFASPAVKIFLGLKRIVTFNGKTILKLNFTFLLAFTVTKCISQDSATSAKIKYYTPKVEKYLDK